MNWQNQLNLYLPKAELNTKTSPNDHHYVAVWVRFGVQLDYSCRLKSVPSNGINRVHGFPRQIEHVVSKQIQKKVLVFEAL